MFVLWYFAVSRRGSNRIMCILVDHDVLPLLYTMYKIMRRYELVVEEGHIVVLAPKEPTETMPSIGLLYMQRITFNNF